LSKGTQYRSVLRAYDITFERCGWTEAALGGGLVWPMADCCRWRNRRMEKTSLGLCSSKGTALWTSA